MVVAVVRTVDFGMEIELGHHNRAVYIGKERLEIGIEGQPADCSDYLDHWDLLGQGHGRAGSLTS